MGRDLRLFLLTVGLPALVLTGAGIRLVQIEMHRAARTSAMQRVKAQVQTERAENPARPARFDRPGREGRRPPGARSAGPRFPHPPGFRGPRMMRVFTEEDELASDRVMWLGGCLVGLLFLSLVSGGWLLVRSARRAREDAMRKTDFVSNVSHEFKTPLTTIRLCAELAQDESLGPDRRRKALASILSESNRLQALVLQALDFSRLEKNRRPFAIERQDVVPLLEESVESMAERFAANGLKVEVGEGTSRLASVDAAAFRQIVVILLDNAAKYAAKGGPVEVELRDSAGTSGLTLSVADRGPGLDANGLRHAFDRFWRGDDATTAETGGSGLGLAIARELAKGMRGALSVVPREGGGLVFTLALPV